MKRSSELEKAHLRRLGEHAGHATEGVAGTRSQSGRISVSGVYLCPNGINSRLQDSVRGDFMRGDGERLIRYIQRKRVGGGIYCR